MKKNDQMLGLTEQLTKASEKHREIGAFRKSARRNLTIVVQRNRRRRSCPNAPESRTRPRSARPIPLAGLRFA